MLETALSKEDFESNNKRKKALIEFIYSGEAILMAGAGVTAEIYPPWSKLMDLLDEEAKAIDPNFDGGDKKDYLEFANLAKACLGPNRYCEIVAQLYGPSEISFQRHHKMLCGLPFRSFTTTNYDIVLENALIANWPRGDYSLVLEGTNPGSVHQYLMSLNDGKAPKKVFHLHGIYNRPGSIVLSGEEYRQKYGFAIRNDSQTLYDQVTNGLSKEEFDDALHHYGYEWTLGRKLLWALLTTRRLVFAGFAFSDPYFVAMLNLIKIELGTYNGSSHFLIMRLTDNERDNLLRRAKELKREYGIETVFYFDQEGDYNGFATFIEGIHGPEKKESGDNKIMDDNLVNVVPKQEHIDSNTDVLKAIKKQLRDEDQQR